MSWIVEDELDPRAKLIQAAIDEPERLTCVKVDGKRQSGSSEGIGHD
jgi:hypothetical protein